METKPASQSAYPTFAARFQVQTGNHEQPAAPHNETDQLLIDFTGATKTQSYGGSKCSTC